MNHCNCIEGDDNAPDHEPTCNKETKMNETTTTPPADVMRMEYRPLSGEESAQVIAIKGNAMSLYGFLGTLGTSRELSLAKTKLEEVVMWATKHVTR